MSAVMETELSSPSVLPDSSVLSQPLEGHTARLESRRLKSSVAVISAHGEIDVSNAGTLAEYTLGHVTGCRGLILDLRGVDFFGAKGFWALHKVSAGCARAGIGWALVPSAAVSRVLRWRASRFPDCGPNRVRSGKGERNWLGNTRNTSLNFVTRLRSSWLSRIVRLRRWPVNTGSMGLPWAAG